MGGVGVLVRVERRPVVEVVDGLHGAGAVGVPVHGGGDAHPLHAAVVGQLVVLREEGGGGDAERTERRQGRGSNPAPGPPQLPPLRCSPGEGKAPPGGLRTDGVPPPPLSPPPVQPRGGKRRAGVKRSWAAPARLPAPPQTLRVRGAREIITVITIFFFFFFF